MAINLKRKNRKFKEPISEINVTPFVDVMLVLLIIFMVTAPLLTTGVKVNLPESSSKVLSEKDKTVTVTINKKKEIFIQKKKLTQTEMIKKLFSRALIPPETKIKVASGLFCKSNVAKPIDFFIDIKQRTKKLGAGIESWDESRTQTSK